MQVRQLLVVVAVLVCGLSILAKPDTALAAFFEPTGCEDLKSRLSEYEMFLACEDDPACLGKFEAEKLSLGQFLDTKLATIATCSDETKRPLGVWTMDPRESAWPRFSLEVFKRSAKSMANKEICEMAQMSLAAIVRFEAEESMMTTERVLKQEDAFSLFQVIARQMQRQSVNCAGEGVNLLLGLTDFEPEISRFPAFYLDKTLAALPSVEIAENEKAEFLRSFIERSLDLSPSVTERVLASTKLPNSLSLATELFKSAIENLNLPAAKMLREKKFGAVPAEVKGWLCQSQPPRGPWSREMVGEALGLSSANCPRTKTTTAATDF